MEKGQRLAGIKADGSSIYIDIVDLRTRTLQETVHVKSWQSQ